MCLNKLNCSTYNNYVCEYEKNKLQNSIEDLSYFGGSQKDFIFYFGLCYYVSPNKAYWTDAMADCFSKNSYLMMFADFLPTEIALLDLFNDHNNEKNYYVIFLLIYIFEKLYFKLVIFSRLLYNIEVLQKHFMF